MTTNKPAAAVENPSTITHNSMSKPVLKANAKNPGDCNTQVSLFSQDTLSTAPVKELDNTFPKVSNVSSILTQTPANTNTGLFSTDRAAFNKQLAEAAMGLPAEYNLVAIRIENGKPTKRPGDAAWQKTEFDRSDIAKKIKAGSASGVGLKLGDPSGGIVALDVDGLVAQEALAAVLGGDHLPRTVAFTSGKTGCVQYLLRVPADKQAGLKNSKTTHVNEAAAKGEDLDFRWTGEQSVLPPSAHPETAGYFWVEGCSPAETEIAEIPEKLLAYWQQLINPIKPVTAPRSKGKAKQAPTTNKGFDQMLAAAVDKVANCLKGGRNTTLNDKAYTLAGLFPDRLAEIKTALTEAALSSGLEPSEIEKTLDSALAKGAAKPISLDDPNKDLPGILKLDESILSMGETVRLNQMTGKVEVDGEPLDLNQLRRFTAKRFGYTLTTEDCLQCWIGAGQEKPYHPVVEYLTGLPETTPMLDLAKLANTLMGNDSELASILLKRKLIAAVARVMRPGCKEDSLLVLVGAQGARKSSFIEVLASEDWFSSDLSDITNKDHLRLLVENWLLELGEVDDVLNSKTNEAVKKFTASRKDTYRPAYGRENVTAQRSATLWATTNKTELLNDPTGSRRLWVIEVKQRIDTTHVKAIRDSIWYSALQAYKAGEQWYLTDDEDVMLKEAAKQFAEVDVWAETLDLSKVTVKHKDGWAASYGQILNHLGVQGKAQDRLAKKRVASVMTHHGFELIQAKSNGQNAKVWYTTKKTWLDK